MDGTSFASEEFRPVFSLAARAVVLAEEEAQIHAGVVASATSSIRSKTTPWISGWSGESLRQEMPSLLGYFPGVSSNSGWERRREPVERARDRWPRRLIWGMTRTSVSRAAPRRRRTRYMGRR